MKSGYVHTAFVVIFVLGLCVASIAAETVPSSPVAYDTFLSHLIQYVKVNFNRASWDFVMRWINFLILVAIIVKYARIPVKDYLKGEQAEKTRLIERIEEKKQIAEDKIEEGRLQLQISQERLERIKDRIVSEGQRQKEKMIFAAKQESRIMLDSAREKIDGQIREAYQQLRVELIEAAADQALTKLPSLMTDDDHESMIGLWMEQV